MYFSEDVLVASSMQDMKSCQCSRGSPCFFLSVQMLEGNVTAPCIHKRKTLLPPALTILSQTVLAALFGLIGLILATPLTAILLFAVRMIYVDTFLERDRMQASRSETPIEQAPNNVVGTASYTRESGRRQSARHSVPTC